VRNVLRRIEVVLGGWLIRRPRRLAAAYLSGHGIEIGALHARTPVPLGVTVRYVDQVSVEELRRQYPNSDDEGFVRVDLIDDAQTLSTFPDASEDFVIANHVLEHMEDPISMIGNAMRVLTKGGVLLLSVPDKRYTFDADRPITTLQHLLDDHADGGRGSRQAHFRECVALVEKVAEADVDTRVAELMGTGQSIHFHVWTWREMLELIMYLRTVIGFEMEFFTRRSGEVIFVLRKGSD
jgi:SAM-dependent methyltransferase